MDNGNTSIRATLTEKQKRAGSIKGLIPYKLNDKNNTIYYCKSKERIKKLKKRLGVKSYLGGVIDELLLNIHD